MINSITLKLLKLYGTLSKEIKDYSQIFINFAEKQSKIL